MKRAGANERRRHATGEQKKKGWRNSLVNFALLYLQMRTLWKTPWAGDSSGPREKEEEHAAGVQ